MGTTIWHIESRREINNSKIVQDSNGKPTNITDRNVNHYQYGDNLAETTQKGFKI
jgi:hypothetical protein